MEEKEGILKENFFEYYNLGLSTFEDKKYNSATTLFFKAIIALCDIYILRKEGRIPTSHADRFRLAEEKFGEIYLIIDRDFPFYQDSYTKKLDKEAAELIKNDIEKIRKILGI